MSAAPDSANIRWGLNNKKATQTQPGASKYLQEQSRQFDLFIQTLQTHTKVIRKMR